MALGESAVLVALLLAAVSLTVSFPDVKPEGCAYSGVTYCVSSTTDDCSDPCCTAVACNTLMYYVEKRLFTTNDTTFLFLSGEHQLLHTLLVEDISNLKFQGKDGVNATVRCNASKEAGLNFLYVKNLTINNLQVTECTYFAYERCLAIGMYRVTNLSMNSVTIFNIEGIGLKLTNLYGNSHINDTTIENSFGIFGQNLVLYCYNDTHYNGSSTVLVENSVIQYGNQTENREHHQYSSGVFVHIACDLRVNLTLKKVNVTNNRVDGYSSGGNIAIQYMSYSTEWRINISIIDCLIAYGHSNIGGGLYFNAFRIPGGQYDDNDKTVGTAYNNKTVPILTVTRTTFLENESLFGAGAYVRFRETQWPMVGRVTFSECRFHGQNLRDKRSSQHGGVAVHVRSFQLPVYVPHKRPLLKLEFLDCNFTANRIPSTHLGVPSSLYAGESHNGVLYIQGIDNATLSGCRILDNNCSGIVAIQSWLFLEGVNLIQNNTGVRGGGIVLCSRSIIYLHENLTLNITGNKVTDFGGGIYVESECDQDIPHCFFQVNNTHSRLNNTHVFLTNNTARAGEAIYGGMVDYCVLYMNITQNYTKDEASKTFRSIFHIEPEGKSSISSNPSSVCFCDGKTYNEECMQNKTLYTDIVPGMEIVVYVMLLGQRNGTTPGIVKAYTSGNIEIDVSQKIQETEQNTTHCTKLTYTVFSDEEDRNGTLQLVPAGGSFEYSGSEKMQDTAGIEFQIEKCPLGSIIDNTTEQCKYLLSTKQCQDPLGTKTEYITRNIVVKNNPPVWIGYWKLKPTPNTSDIIFHKFCTLGYCSGESTVRINTTYNSFDQDAQCAEYRTGLLCGSCKRNYSLGFGSSQCLSGCNTHHRYLQYLRVCGLVAVCGVAGVLLVVLLTVLNLTVAEGTLNGLIFYANIVQVNVDLFFPSDTHTRPWTAFIAWLNLDFGITVCFYDGMDAYVKTWLQFIFPLYIWILAGGIIYFSRISKKIAKLSGKNSVKVLATLFLLSFGKLNRTVIAATIFTNLKSCNKHINISVWLLDANVHYLHGAHIVLFVAGCIAGLVVVLYALTLTFIQCLRRAPNSRMCGLVQRLKPLMDAYTGPYNDGYHFWTGFLLLVRIGLFGAFTFNFYNNPTLNFTLIIIVSAVLLVATQRGIYKNKLIGLLESLLYLNLLLFAAIMMFMLDKYTHYRKYVAHFFGSLTLLKFLGIVAYHTYQHWVKPLKPGSGFDERQWVNGPKPVLPVLIQKRDSEDSSSSEEEPENENERDLSNTAWLTPDFREPLIVNGSL